MIEMDKLQLLEGEILSFCDVRLKQQISSVPKKKSNSSRNFACTTLAQLVRADINIDKLHDAAIYHMYAVRTATACEMTMAECHISLTCIAFLSLELCGKTACL